MAREYVPIFFDWTEVTGELNAQEKGRLIDAIVLYAQGGNWQEQIKGNERYLFPAFKRQIDRSAEYSETMSKAAKEREQNKAQKAQSGTNEHKEAQSGTKSTEGHNDGEEIRNKSTSNKEGEEEKKKEKPPDGGKKTGTRKRTKTVTAARYQQREYSEEDLEALIPDPIVAALEAAAES